MAEKYRLQYFFHTQDVLAITWENNNGDCRVRALKESSDVDRHNKSHFQTQTYSEPMTLAEARKYIYENTNMLGTMIHDCVGLYLEDSLMDVEFKDPIVVRELV